MAKKPKKRDSRQSSGKRKAARINGQINKLLIKIKRWERYQKEIQERNRKGSVKRWDTSWLKKHIETLENCL